MLYTGKEIAEKYSTEAIKLTQNVIRRWTNQGLKHIRGPHNTYLYKAEWVDSFIEEQAQNNVEGTHITDFEVRNKPSKRMKRYDFSEMKVY